MLAEIVLAVAASPIHRAADDGERVARALAWLEPRVDADAWTKVDMQRSNAAAKRIVVDALVGWLELVRTDRAADEALLAKLDARIRSHLGAGSGSMGAFANWTDGFAALYAAERAMRDRGGKDALAKIVRGFELRQNAEGGWDHGASFGVSFYPSTLVATTNLGLIALGLARRLGLDTDPETVASGLSLLGDVQSQGGGMPYGGRPYTKGIEAGRTCGTVLALSSLDLGADPRCTRAASYVLRNVDAIPDGHASTAFHVFIGALACGALGPAASQAFDEQVLARVRAGQSDDGSFEGIVRGSPDDLALMSDADTNRAYVTALHAAALLAKSSKIGEALHLAKPFGPTRAEPTPATALKPSWSFAMEHTAFVACVGERVLAIDRAGRGHWLSPKDGKPTGDVDLALGDEAGHVSSTADSKGVLVWKSPAGDDAVVIIAGGISGGAQDESRTTMLAFASADDGGPRWTHPLAGQLTAAAVAGEHVIVSTISGRVRVLARADGAFVRELPALGVLPNVSLCPTEPGRIVIGAEARLACMPLTTVEGASEAQSVLWERKNRLRGLTPPAWTALAWGGTAILAGRTDGYVVALGAHDGATQWEARTGSCVRRIAVDDASGRAFALGFDGRIVAVDEGQVAWQRDVDLGRESHAEPAIAFSRGALWTASPARGSIVCIDPKDGRILGEHAWSDGRSWSPRGRTLVLMEGDGVSASSVP